MYVSRPWSVWTILPAAVLWAAFASAGETLATRQMAFQIPYRIDPPGNSVEQPTEVQLYVSADRGGSWKLHSRVPPDQGRFPFKAEKDGEYWFLVRTKDSTGRLVPSKPNQPELKVVVDTTQPALEMHAVQGEAGEIAIRWRATDGQLQPQNLKLDYQTKGAADLWQSIAIDPRRTQISAGMCQGDVTLWIPRTAEPIIIRGEISDRAGNIAVTQTQVESPKVPDNVREQSAESRAGDSRPVYPDTGAPAQVPLPTTKPGEPAAKTPPAPADKPGSLFPALGMRWPADRQTRAPLARAASQASPAPPAVQRLAPSSMAAGDNQTQPPAADWVPPGLADVKPPTRQLVNPQAAISSVSSAAAAGYQPPPGVRPRMVNSRTFHLEYDVTSNVSAGAQRVELWGTRDGGQRWSSYGADTDARSPMTVTVEGEGMFGFCIVVQTASGIIESPPASGHTPDTWIGVDVTRPTCRITQLRQEKAEQAQQLILTWEAHDQWLAERPISLSYSVQPGGPWLPVATGLENTGRYSWPLDNRVPERFYLRLEARDQAGNVEVYQSPEAVTVSHSAPPGRIREVRPTYESSEGPRRYRF